MKSILLLLSFTAFHLFTTAQPIVGFPTTIVTGLTSPVDIVNAKDSTNRLFIVQQNGIIRVYSGGTLLPANFLNLSSVINFDGAERGLLSLVFHPGYATNRYFFVYYNNASGAVELAQCRTSASNPNVADPASRKVLLTIPKPFTNHNGCKLNFGPDGNLYFGTGDGGSGGDPGNRAQDPANLLGKMLRINVDNFTDATVPYYDIPATNPFVGVSGYAPEIYALGLRNPWRWNFDRQTNDMWIADVGQNLWEEVNYLPFAQTSGVNYGWRCYEATHVFNTSACGSTPAVGKIMPVFEYPHTDSGGFSITGGLVYRGTEFTALQGYYICADYTNSNGWLLKPTGTGGVTFTKQINFPEGISTFGDAEDGTLYAVTLAGSVYKVTVTGSLPIRLLSFNGRFLNDRDILNWTTTVDAGLARFEIEQSENGTRFTTVGTQSANTMGTTAAYQFSAQPGTIATRFYRIKMVYADGTVSYSAIVKIGSGQQQQITVSYNGTKQIQLSTPYDFKSVTVFNLTGQKMYALANVKAGNRILPADNFISGMYVVNCVTNDGTQKQFKIMVQ